MHNESFLLTFLILLCNIFVICFRRYVVFLILVEHQLSRSSVISDAGHYLECKSGCERELTRPMEEQKQIFLLFGNNLSFFALDLEGKLPRQMILLNSSFLCIKLKNSSAKHLHITIFYFWSSATPTLSFLVSNRSVLDMYNNICEPDSAVRSTCCFLCAVSVSQAANAPWAHILFPAKHSLPDREDNVFVYIIFGEGCCFHKRNECDATSCI